MIQKCELWFYDIRTEYNRIAEKGANICDSQHLCHSNIYYIYFIVFLSYKEYQLFTSTKDWYSHLPRQCRRWIESYKLV